MSAPGSTEQLCFTFTSVITPKGDGTYIVRPGRLVRPVEYVSTAEIQRRTGLKKSQAVELAKKLDAQQGGKGCKLRIPAAELEKWLERKAHQHS
jgi:hypothetical protein